MLRVLIRLILLVCCWVDATGFVRAEEVSSSHDQRKTSVVVIPVRDEIAEPILFILRRGLKENTDVVVLDMKTPGGALDVTLEIMDALGKFPGKTITFVNTEALSAGAFISAATDEIYFAPGGKIGAAAPVTSTGQDVDKTMKQKVVSYLKASVRSISEGKGRYRGQVLSAMIDENYELKIGDKVLKEKGELLTLTATEASATYGDPPQALLSAGTAKSIDDLLAQKFDPGHYEVRTVEITWAERLAQYLVVIRPILLGLGLLALFVEFKTPGFGVFGITGIALLAVVFLSNYVAGLSGHEPLAIFALGLILLIAEVFFLPGTMILAISGLALMAGSLIWSMADIWPNQPISFSADVFLTPLLNLTGGVLIAVVLALLLLRFLPKGWIWDRLIVNAPSAAGEQLSPVYEPEVIGRRAIAATALMPSGQIELDGRRYEARVDVGTIAPGVEVTVVKRTGFALLVEKAKS
jgi:membrane-bound serine protease (ClpP class)